MGRSGRERDRSWPPDPEPLPHPLVDDHTHLDHPAPGATGFDGGPTPPTLAEQVERAARAGVTRMVQVGCDLPAARWTADVVRVDDGVPVHPALLGAVALHPNEAPLHAGVREVGPDGLEPAPQEHHAVDLDAALAEIERLARTTERIRAIGETGLDFFRSGERGREVQRESFRAHIALAKELGLALQIHDRDAHDDVLDVLERDGAPERTVFHCFSGDAAMARRCADSGWYLSFAGTVTFSASHELRAALRAVPLTQVLLETDAPYLTPHPYRGRPNAPYTVAHTARTVAETLDVDLETLCRTVWRTAEQVYGPW
ncbi:TatD family hydrolase [Actinotalea ferrariae]|uniref:TatD family hydrolase n=1 Tax=Actinotalea ferrariae TaxID=1386098 RepID=UPI001C8B28B2|nr:TatD family hydrolase [Actinotalea ferrariae]MBX9243355.1 TatD family hydrolase [Actinotalea ferrariae]